EQRTPANEDGDRRAMPPSRSKPARVELRDVSIAYGHGPRRRQVLDHLTATFTPGRLTAVTGRSGVGKSTLLRLVAGLEPADDGVTVICATNDPFVVARADRMLALDG